MRSTSLFIFGIVLVGHILSPPLLHSYAYPYERMEIVKVLERQPESLKILRYIPLDPQDRLFAPSYWKVYYQGQKIIGEELFEAGRLSYYYVYFYEGEKVFQKGFFWNGIYRDIISAKLGKTRIKQGYLYKNIPDTYRVYDRQTLKQLYSYNYPNKDI